MVTDTIELGGSIELTGFSEVDKGKMIVLKKIIGNYARKFSDKTPGFEKLTITQKKIHTTEGNIIYEIDAKVMDSGQTITAELTDRNLFVGIDSVLKKIENQIQ